MTFAYVVVLVSVLGLIALLVLGKRYWFGWKVQDPTASELPPIDVEAFRNLIDEGEEDYLKQHLPAKEFRKIHRERMLVAVEYVKGAYRNAGILVRIAEAARDSADPQTAEAGGKLFEDAVSLRWYAIQVIPRLYLRVLLPGTSHDPRALFDRYDFLARQAFVLRRAPSTLRNV